MPTSLDCTLHYRLMFMENKAVMLLIDPNDGTILEASLGACQYYGYSLSELTAMKIFDINTMSKAEITAEMQRAKEESKIHFNFRHRLASGEVRDVEVYSNPIPVEGQTFLFSIIHDTTELKQAEEQYRNLFERTGTGMAVVEADGTISLINHTFAKLAEADESEIIGHSFLEGLAEVDKARMQEYHLKRLRGEAAPDIYEFQFKSLKGREGWALLNLTFFPDSGRSLASVIDITERKQAEESLRKSETKYRLAMEATNEGLWDWDVAIGSVYYSPGWNHILGEEDVENNYSTWEDRIHPEDKPHILNTLRSHLVGETTAWQEEHRLRNSNGNWVWVLGRGQVVERDDQGSPLRMVGTMTDITERKQDEEALKQSESLLAKSQAVGHVGSWNLDVVADRLAWSDEVYRIFGLYPQEFDATYEAFLATVHPDDRAMVDAAYTKSVREGRDTYEIEHRIIRQHSGEIRFIYEKCHHVKDESGRIIQSVGMVQDNTERKRAEAEREQLLHDMGQRMKELQCMFGITEAIRKYDKLEDILMEAVRITPLGLHYPEYTKARIILDDKEFIERPFELTEWKLSGELILDNECSGAVEVYYTKEFPELDEGPFLVQERNLIDSIAKVISEAIERKQAKSELEYLATHDPLTDLYNRKMLIQKFTDELFRASRYDHSLSLFMIDIDHFKAINDTYGHQAGDTVLRGIADILKSLIRRTDYAARYGGEEFIIILPETPLAKAEELAERLRNKINEHSISIADDKELNITTSIGVATFPEHAQTWEDMLNAVDSAMYAAKDSGRNCVRVANNTCYPKI